MTTDHPHHGFRMRVAGRLAVLHRHRVTTLEHSGGMLSGVCAIDEARGAEVRLQAPVVVLAMGGLNGGHDEVRRNWPAGRPRPAAMLNGAHPFADGRLHRHAADALGARVTHAGEMWNYAAGFPHPLPHFEGHGLSTIPCKSALWLDHTGRRIGPEPSMAAASISERGMPCSADRKKMKL